MAIRVIGIDYQSAPDDIRQKFHLTTRKITELYQLSSIPEPMVVLSTCNRTEIFMDTQIRDSQPLYEMATSLISDDEADSGYFYQYQGEEALRHLLELGVGLKSMITGETEILGQISDAFQLALQYNADLGGLETIFKKSILYARSIRLQSKIGNYSLSLPNMALKEVKHYYGSLPGRRLLILGNGVMAQKMIRVFLSSGVDITTISRNPGDYSASPQINAVHGWENLDRALDETEFVIAATSAPHLLLTVEHAGMLGGKVLIDLSFPRNIDPLISANTGCMLWDLEYFHRLSEGNLFLKNVAAETARFLCLDAARKIWTGIHGTGLSKDIITPVDKLINDGKLELINATDSFKGIDIFSTGVNIS